MVRNSSERWQLAGVAVVAAGVGWLVPRIHPTVVIATFTVIVAFAAGAVIWGRVRAAQLAGLPQVDIPDDGAFRNPRNLLFAGLATSCWLQLRAGGVTLSDAIFAVALGLAAVEYVTTNARDRSLIPQGVWLGVLCYSVGGVASTMVYSTDKSSSYATIARVVYLILAWFWLAAVCLRTRQHIWTALKWWVVSAAVCGGWVLAQKYGHLPGDLLGGRYGGLSDHPNDLGELTACAFVPALALAYRDHRWIIAVAGVAVGLAFSGSIGGLIAAITGLAFGLCSRDLARPTLIALAIGASALVLASPLIGSSALTRFSTSTDAGAQYGQDTFQSRLLTYRLAWERIKANPFLGVGEDVPSSSILDAQTATSYQVHNLFLGRWYSSGIFGLVGVLMIVGSIGLLGWRLIIRSPDRYLAIALFAGYVAYLIDDMSEPSLYQRFSLVPALLMISLAAVAARAARPVRQDWPAPMTSPSESAVLATVAAV